MTCSTLPIAFSPTLGAALVPAGVAPWWFFTAVILAPLIFGLSKSGFGGGGIGILGVVLMANVMPAEQAMGVVLPLILLSDVIALAQHHKHRSWFHLRWCLIGGLAGVGLGTLILWLFQSTGSLTTWLDLTIGLVCLVFVALQCYRMAGGRLPTVPNNAGASLTAGFTAGSASTVAHAAGPIMTIYLLEHRLKKQVLVGTLVTFFFLLNVMKLPTFIGLGLMTPQTLVRSALLIPLVPIGSLLGIVMHHRIPEKAFTLLLYAAAAVAGARMVYLAV